MRIAVIRNDLPGPVRLQDLEPVSQQQSSIQPKGQERYLSRVTTTQIETVLASSSVGAGAVLRGTTLTFNIVINSGNNVLRLRTASTDSFTVVTLAQATYTTNVSLLAAINAALLAANLSTTVLALAGTGAANRVALESLIRGVNSYIELDTVGNGSTGNTILGLTNGARTMPAASVFLGTVPAGGPVDVRTATIEGLGATTNSTALGLIATARGTTAALQDLLAPRFADTSVAIDSYIGGTIAKYLASTYNPDPNRGFSGLTALPNGAAVAVTADDGNTAVTFAAPAISNAALSGSLTITGTNMGSYDRKDTVVKAGAKVLSQAAIEYAGGTVTSTSIVIPSGLLTGVAAGQTAQVKVRQLLSNSFTIV